MDESARPQPGPRPERGDEPDQPPIAPPATEPDATLIIPAIPPAPAFAAPEPEPPAGRPIRTRRWVLAGALAILAGGGAGVGAAFRRRRREHRPPAPPQVLLAAAEAERRLIADLAATTGGTAEVRIVIEQATANHRAHLAALEGLLARYRPPATSASRVPGVPRTKAQLRAAERAASRTAAARAEGQGIALAGLLASIAACEATHAELLA